jgi:hypothetical protein
MNFRWLMVELFINAQRFHLDDPGRFEAREKGNSVDLFGSPSVLRKQIGGIRGEEKQTLLIYRSGR